MDVAIKTRPIVIIYDIIILTRDKSEKIVYNKYNNIRKYNL